MISVGVVGGTGYTGAELLRLLARHPEAELTAVTSRGEAGTAVSELFPHLRGAVDLDFRHPEEAPLEGCDLVFFATPNGTAMHAVPGLLERGVRVIDLAADFRLGDAAEWRQWYGMEHACAQLLSEAVYGLPERYRSEIASARLVANPGCYPTATLLALLPLIEPSLARPASLVVDAKSGVSGAGREARLGSLHCEVSEGFQAYGVPGHRHLPEISRQLALAGGVEPELLFVPHLCPMNRGIHATVYAEVPERGVDLQALFEQRYADEPFVDVLPAGAHPQTRSVRGSNLCRLAVHRPRQGARVVVLSVIDNLVKGAAGQAVQNMNIMFGLPEQTGLDALGMQP